MVNRILERLEVYLNRDRTKMAESENEDAVNYYYARVTALENAKEIVQELAKDGGWIPCSERLPENDFENVLVWFEYFRYGEYNRPFQTHGISYTFHGEWSGMVNGSSGWRDLRVIAWQPLPAPYQKGE